MKRFLEWLIVFCAVLALLISVFIVLMWTGTITTSALDCQYETRSTNTEDMCDNSDPCDSGMIKNNDGRCVIEYRPKPIDTTPVVEVGGGK